MASPIWNKGAPWSLPYTHAELGIATGVTLLLAGAIWHRFNKAQAQTTVAKDSTPRDAKQVQNRAPGSWEPVEFHYPAIEPLSSDLKGVDPIPYRPFRWDQYHITMGIRSMPWNEWIELDKQFEAYHRIRSARIVERGKNVIRVQPAKPGVVQSGAIAAIELLHEVAEYLPQRYPAIFQVTRRPASKSSNGASEIERITIVPLKQTYDLPSMNETGEEEAENALKIVSLLVQEDLALMIEGSDGNYYFQAGAILIAGSWRLQDKIGLRLADIHTKGGVPRYKEKLQLSMDRFFQRLPVDKPVVRNNYTFQVIPPDNTRNTVDPEELAWAETVHGPEDDYLTKLHKDPHARPKVDIANVRLRTERQTLRRLPRSGAIVFGIRTYMTPIETIGKEPGVAARLASSMRAWGEDVGAYKGKPTGGWYDLVLDYLDECGASDGQNNVQREDRFPY